MYYELALISVLIAASYWGLFFIRTGPQMRLYGVMQLGAAVLAGLGLYHRREGGPALLGIAGAIGTGAGACLLLLAPLARATARRFAAAERFKIAARLLDIADLLAPGSGVGEEKALLAAMREIRDGNIDESVGTLTAAREQAPLDARLVIDERIAMLYLAAYRWDDAIAHAEANLFGVELSDQSKVDVGRTRMLPDGNFETTVRRRDSLRGALGIAPPVWVELLGAYGYTNNLEQAARMLARLEQVCAGREDAAIWVHRGRLIFLALAGRVAAVETLVAPRMSKHMSRGARSYWIAVAHERKGEAAAAEAAYAKARSRSRGRPRVLIDRAIERLGNLQPIDLTPLAKELVEQVEQQAPPVVRLRERARAPWATRLLTLSVLGVAAAIALTLGDSSDIGVLVRAGAMVRGFIHAGEWWRIISCNFVHVGGLHLLVNTLGLWFLARECEHMFGPARTVAVFALSGIAGFIASYLASPVGISAGASGAIFGLLGAVFVELTLQRRHHRAAWSRGMWGSLAVIVIGQVGIDFMYSGVTDQYAHAGGALVGAALGSLLSPHARWAKGSLYASRVIAAAFVGVCAFSALMVVRTPIATSLGAADHQVAGIPGLVASAPASWTYDDTLHDPDDLIEVRFWSSNVAKPLDEVTQREEDRVRHTFDRIDIATEHVVPLPAGWDGRELAISSEEPNEVGGRQHYRLIIAAKPVQGGVVLVSIEVADSIARAAPGLFTAIIASVAVK
ncbi:MAG: rhomboid family intramembrane serine protease [Deltaproteobacteria bacterium]